MLARLSRMADDKSTTQEYLEILKAAREVKEKISGYGRYCPKCGAPSIGTDRTMSDKANDVCSGGHKYLRKSALTEKPKQ